MMVLAGHHVIKDIAEVVEKKDIKKLRELQKFCERYPNDEELQTIMCGESSLAEEYIVSGDETSQEKLKKELHDLLTVRQIETSGGEKLWFKDRRP